MRRTISLEIPGLDLVLGGGVVGVRRGGSEREGAVILIRGAPGTGKTILAMVLASSLARTFEADVVHGCVEILPEELAAQHEGLARGGKERVLVYPFEQVARGGTRSFAATLDLRPNDETVEAAGLGDALAGLLAAAKDAGGDPRVLVIDSLSDGYGLGQQLPRLLVDAVCKFAIQRGLFVILVEETTDPRPSNWSFAADTVLELAGGESPSLVVSKHRFSQMDRSRHGIVIEAGVGVRVLPDPSAYLQPWAEEFLQGRWTSRGAGAVAWPIPQTNAQLPRWQPPGWPSLRQSSILCYGHEPEKLTSVQGRVQRACMQADNRRADLIIDLHGITAPPDPPKSEGWKQVRVYAGDPHHDGARFLDDALRALVELSREHVIGCVLVGDLRALRSFRDGDSVFRALAAFRAIVRRRSIPLILHESVQSPLVESQYQGRLRPPVPRGGDIADVLIWVDHPSGVIGNPQGGGTTIQLNM